MEGMSSLEPLEQSVLNTLSAARPEEGITEELSDREPVALPVLDITLNGRPMEGTTYLEHSALGCLWTVDSWRGCRAWNHSSSRFLVCCWSHDLLKYSRRGHASAFGSGVACGCGHSNLELSARPMLDPNQAGYAELDTDTSEHSALMTNVDFGFLKLDARSCPLGNVALGRRPMEEITYPLPVESLGLALAPDGHVEHLPSSIRF